MYFYITATFRLTASSYYVYPEYSTRLIKLKFFVVQNAGEEVIFRPDLRWAPEEESIMLVDSGEEEWQRLHDVRLNGTVLEYIGRGKSLVDVGLAQARTPIGTRNHYFEIEVRPALLTS